MTGTVPLHHLVVLPERRRHLAVLPLQVVLPAWCEAAELRRCSQRKTFDQLAVWLSTIKAAAPSQAVIVMVSTCNDLPPTVTPALVLQQNMTQHFTGDTRRG